MLKVWIVCHGTSTNQQLSSCQLPGRRRRSRSGPLHLASEVPPAVPSQQLSLCMTYYQYRQVLPI